MEKEVIDNLIEQFKNGSELAFSKLYKIYKPLVWKITYDMIHNRDLADDLSSIIFTKVYTKIDSYVNNISFGMWIKTITVNTVIDYIRKYKYEKLNKYLDDDACQIQIQELDLSPEEKSIIEEKLNLTLSLIPSLKKIQREILEARVDGLSYKKISEKFNIDEEQVKTILNKARKVLKQKLDNIYNKKS